METHRRAPAVRELLVREGTERLWPRPMEGTAVFTLPLPTCYIDLFSTEKMAFERGLSRLFIKEASSIEVFNDGEALSRLFRAVRDCP